jgi:hypothetical protein
MLETVLSYIETALRRERELSPHAVHRIRSRYTIGEDEIPAFFQTRVPKMDETELDLVFSSLFTPTVEDIACFSSVLEEYTPPKADIERMIRTLADRKPTAAFHYQGRTLRMAVPPPAVERYVRLLYLDRKVPVTLAEKIERVASGQDVSKMKALIRCSPWIGSDREAIVSSVLDSFANRGSYSYETFEFLIDFIKTYRPNTVSEAESRLKNLIHSYETDSDGSFFDDYLKEAYAEGDRVEVTRKSIEGRNLREIWKSKSEMGKRLLLDLQAARSRP